MKRAKLGDVYCIKVPNGYKLFQWAYSVPRKGEYIRVFDGLYDPVPENIEQIVDGPHSYIISFYATRAYRVGLAQLLGNFPVPSQYPFPKFQIRFRIDRNTGQADGIHVMNSDGTRDVWAWFDVCSITELPEEYRSITLLNGTVTPNWLLYLFDNGFDLLHPERYYLGSNPEDRLQKYGNIVNETLSKHQAVREL